MTTDDPPYQTRTDILGNARLRDLLGFGAQGVCVIDWVNEHCLANFGKGDVTLDRAIDRMAATDGFSRARDVLEAHCRNPLKPKVNMRDLNLTKVQYWDALHDAHCFLAAHIPERSKWGEFEPQSNAV